MNKRYQLLQDHLNSLLIDFPPVQRVWQDPVSFPRKFLEVGRSVAEIEAVALLSAMLAYGRVTLFMNVIRQILEASADDFLGLITRQVEIAVWPKYRLSTADDIKRFCEAIGALIQDRGGLFPAFSDGWKGGGVKPGLISLRSAILAEVSQTGPLTRGLLHLLPDPGRGGCVKRWQMFLRWLVRPNDGVDLGLWNQIPSKFLLIPVDRHISRISRYIGLTSRKTDDWETAEQISRVLRQLSPEDPIKYDFAICHLGISGKCSHGVDLSDCKNCSLEKICQIATS